MDSAPEELMIRLLSLLSTNAANEISLGQAANILGVPLSILLNEVTLGPSAIRESVSYDAEKKTVSLSKHRLAETMNIGLVTATSLMSDTEAKHSGTLSSLLKRGYHSDTNVNTAKVRRRGAVRKARHAIGLAQLPPPDHQVGRVGYICVADEFNLSALESYYRGKGYFTKMDFDVLHIRFADTDLVADEPSSQYGGTDGRSGSTGERNSREKEEKPSGTLAFQQSNGFDLFLFEYGAVVWWGYNNRYFRIVEADFMLPRSPISDFIIRRYSTQIVNENYPVWCTYTLVLKETLELDQDFKDLLRFDHFLIPYGRGDPSTCSISMLCASHALAQSAKIDYLEIKVNELTLSCTPLPRELREKGTVTVSERRLLQLRGEVLSYRLMLRSGSDLIDEPSFFWENGYLKPVFQATKEGFEISSRVEALDNKLDATNEILSMLADEFSQRHGARLEWIVIWLVFVEVIIGVLELLVDVRPWIHRL